MSDSEIIRDQLEVYRRSFLEHGDSPLATFNTGREVQRLRFDRLLAPLLPLRSPFTIHDVGAGLCDLHAHLNHRGIAHEYSATEIVPEMIETARAKYPEIAIHQRDLLAELPADRHDFVVLSGAFNIPGATAPDAWRAFVLAMVRRMYEMARLAVAFNFLTAHRTRTDPDLYYIDPGEMLAWCAGELSRFVLLDHSAPLFECTMTVLRPEVVAAEHRDPAFAKYFKVPRVGS
jgi:hypothetical protein